MVRAQQLAAVQSCQGADSRPSSSAVNGVLSILLHPLRAHLLHQLPVRALLALRRTCSVMRDLVDNETGPQWLDIARQLRVAEQLLPQDAVHAPAVHSVLRDQASLVASIRKAQPSLVHQGNIGLCTHVELTWLLHHAGLGANLIACLRGFMVQLCKSAQDGCHANCHHMLSSTKTLQLGAMMPLANTIPMRYILWCL